MVVYLNIKTIVTTFGTTMTDYIDGFVFPIPHADLSEYQRMAKAVAAIWREHGALDYQEYVGDDMTLAGTRTFMDATAAKADEAIVFGWVSFASREARDQANKKVAADPRMETIMESVDVGFDAERMVYGGFKPLVELAQ